MIDRTLFQRSEQVRAVRVDKKLVNKILKHPDASSFMWASSGKKSVQPCPDCASEFRLVLVQKDIPADLLAELAGEYTSFEVPFTFDDFSTDEALRVLLPDFKDPPSSFETIGHIAHMNLRDEFMPHKDVIGEVILAKNSHINVVVTKVGKLSNEFRTFDMEIIGSRDGDRSLVASVSEDKMTFKVDYENCYWNSRLSNERQRLLTCFAKTDPEQSRLIDMCCGVGALACRSARTGMEVFANDLNPVAVDCLRTNARKNHVDVSAFNMDAREFCRLLVKNRVFAEPKTNHVMINLPEIGLEFLDVFHGLFASEADLHDNTFHIYCHCFSKDNPPMDVKQRALTALGVDDGAAEAIEMKIVHVRDVAPSKIMYSVEFEVPRSVLVSSKRPRMDDIAA